MFWVLVTYDGMTSGSQEFTSKQSCLTAAANYASHIPTSRSPVVSAWCEKK